MSIIIEPKPIEQLLIPKDNYPEIRSALGRLGIKVTKRAMQSDNYEADVEGWKLSEALAEFENIKSRGNMERNDFHWITLFESLDGYDTGGTVAVGFVKVEIDTGAVSGNSAYIAKSPLLNFNRLTWDKDRKVRTKIHFENNASQTIWLITGNISANEHIGFKVIDGVLYGTVADGTTEATLNCGNISTSSDGMPLEVKLKAGVSAEFFVDDVSKGTIITNLPSGTAFAYRMIYLAITTNENVAKGINASFYEFWQAV